MSFPLFLNRALHKEPTVHSIQCNLQAFNTPELASLTLSTCSLFLLSILIYSYLSTCEVRPSKSLETGGVLRYRATTAEMAADCV